MVGRVLTVHLLGPVEARRHGEPVELGGPQQRAVLAHLALDVGRVVSVERLIDRIWGDDASRGSLGTLQSYVSRLRRALEPARRAGSEPQLLVSEAPGYVLRLQPDDVDLHRFRTHAADGRAALAAGRLTAALAAFDEALALWRGPALAGVGPDDEIRPIVVRLHEERDAASEARFETLLALGQHVQALPQLQAAVDEHPMRERLWELLALALYRSRRQADALRVLAQAREILLDELGLDPGPELRDLERRILEQDESLQPTTAPPVAEQQSPAERPPLVAQVELVERAAEWQALVQALADTRAGGAGLVLLEGEPGIGKSTLSDAFLAHAASDGWRTATGRCVEPGLAPSLWPAIEIVRTMLGETGREAVASGDAWRLLATGDDEPSRSYSPVEMADRFLEIVDQLGPAEWVLLLDDLHWSDKATLDVTRLVLERLGARRVLVVAAHRPPALVPDSLLGDALGALQRAAPTTRIRMTPLDADGVARLIELTTGVAPSAEVADRVRSRAGGNPLFVTELARLAGERGLGSDRDVPDAIRDVVRSRLALLPERATAELEVAAVLGERFDLRTAMAASERDPDSCLDALDAAIVTRILVPEANGFRFAHALVRDAVLAGVPPLRLARLHHRAADAIIATRGDGPDEAEPVAHHRLASAAFGDPVVAARAAVRASDVARWRASLDTAERLADQALELLADQPRRGDVMAAELAAFEALIDISRRRADDGARAAVADRIARSADRSGSDAAAALALFLRWGDIDETIDLAEVEPPLRLAADIAERTTDPYATVITRFMLGAYDLLTGRLGAAAEHVRIGMLATGTTHANESPQQTPQVLLPVIAGLVAAMRGDADEAREHMGVRAAAWIAARSQVDPTARIALMFNRAYVEALLDDPRAVLTELREPAGFEVPGFVLMLNDTCEVLAGWARVRTGDPTGLDHGLAAMAEVDRGDERILRSSIRTFLGDACLALGDPRAVDLLATARREAETRGEVWWLAETTRLQAEADLRFGDGGASPSLLDEAAALAELQGAELLLPRIAATRARLPSS